MGKLNLLSSKLLRREEKETKTYEGMKGLLDSALHRVQELFANGGKPTGVQTGFHKLDDMINGLQPSDLVIVAGRPLDGKDPFAMNIARSAAINNMFQLLSSAWKCPKSRLR